MAPQKRLANLAHHLARQPAAASYDDVLAAHYRENPHVAAKIEGPRNPAETIVAEAPQSASASPAERLSLAAADDVLAAHYRENPHVAAQLKIGGLRKPSDTISALPKGRMDLATAEEVLAAHFQSAPHIAAQLQAGASTQRRLVSGQGQLTFEYVPELVALPAGLEIKNAHGLAVDADGNIYMTYDTDSVTAESRALVKWRPDGSSPQSVGDTNELTLGTPHGLRYSQENGEQFLYHANNSGLSKTYLDGEIVWSNMQPLVWKGMPYAPTDCLVVPGSDKLIVADGCKSRPRCRRHVGAQNLRQILKVPLSHTSLLGCQTAAASFTWSTKTTANTLA